MSVRRQAAKRDGNEGEIIKALRDAGATVQQLSATGVPDLLVGYRGEFNILMEIKMPKADLTKDQEAWHYAWNGTVWVVHSVREALQVLEFYAERDMQHPLDFAG